MSFDCSKKKQRKQWVQNQESVWRIEENCWLYLKKATHNGKLLLEWVAVKAVSVTCIKSRDSLGV